MTAMNPLEYFLEKVYRRKILALRRLHYLE